MVPTNRIVSGLSRQRSYSDARNRHLAQNELSNCAAAADSCAYVIVAPQPTVLTFFDRRLRLTPKHARPYLLPFMKLGIGSSWTRKADVQRVCELM